MPMKNKPSKIYMLGRKQGIIPFSYPNGRLENSRLDEVAGFKQSANTKRIHFSSASDIIFVRNKPESTNDACYQRINRKLQKIRDNKIIINDINAFYNYDSKDRSFSIWEKNGVKSPAYIVLQKDKQSGNYNKSIEQLLKFKEKYKTILLRTNNETGSRGMVILNENTEVSEILKIIDNLDQRVQKRIKRRNDTKIIAVQFIDTKSDDGFYTIYRAHVLNDEVLSYYGLPSKKLSFHARDLKIEGMEKFISTNQELGKIMDERKLDKLLFKAMNSLGCNLGAIEFFLVNGSPIFLEINPMWGGKHVFGNQEFNNYLLKNKKTLQKEIPMIYKWLSSKEYYQYFYETMANIKAR